MPALQVVAADSDAEARRLFTSTQQAFANMQRNAPRAAARPDRRHRELLVAGREGSAPSTC